jgi:twitching motility protein PilT
MDLFPEDYSQPSADPNSQLAERLGQLEERLTQLEDSLQEAKGQPSGPDKPHIPSQAETMVDLADEIPRPEGMNFTLDDLLRTVIKNRASDLHIKPNSPPTVRLEGQLIPIGDAPLTAEQCRYLVLTALPPYKREPLSRMREVDHAHVSFGVRFRMNAFLERGHFTAAMRMVNSAVPTFDDLGLPPVLSQLASLQDGLVLITGPAGSGKSTTLAAVVDWINQNRRTHVVTIEDPIEYHHKDKTAYITQREVGTDTTSFVEALKQALRQDPNVIMLGEMRDTETIMTAVTAAETGHLVLSTLHTPNTVQAVDRIVDSFDGHVQKQVRMLLATCLRGVVSQKLLNRQDGKGRVPAVEVLVNTPTIASHILDGQTGEIYQYLQRGATDGMQTFNQSLINLLDRGLITYQDAAQVADRKTELRLAREQRVKRPGAKKPAPAPITPAPTAPKDSPTPTSENILDLL